MTKHLVIASLFVAACATTGSVGGGSSKSTGPFQGKEALEKRRTEIFEAQKAVTDCMKVKPGEDPGKGGIFAVVAGPDGKLSAKTIKWEGPPPMSQCIVDTAAKTAITPLPGPPVGMLWEFLPPGAPASKQEPPDDIESRMQAAQNAAGSDVDFCYQNNLPVDFPVDISVAFYVTGDGTVYSPTVIESNSKDGGYDSCVLGVVAKMKLPALPIQNPLPLTIKWHRGKLEKL
jgi:hypothetical protein